MWREHSSAEVAIALRQRFNELSEQLDKLQTEYAQLQVDFDSQCRELVIAKSDCELSYTCFFQLSEELSFWSSSWQWIW